MGVSKIMSDEALKHRHHDLDYDDLRSNFGRFLRIYCNDCARDLGTLNITVILNEMEHEE